MKRFSLESNFESIWNQKYKRTAITRTPCNRNFAYIFQQNQHTVGFEPIPSNTTTNFKKLMNFIAAPLLNLGTHTWIISVCLHNFMQFSHECQIRSFECMQYIFWGRRNDEAWEKPGQSAIHWAVRCGISWEDLLILSWENFRKTFFCWIIW